MALTDTAIEQLLDGDVDPDVLDAVVTALVSSDGDGLLAKVANRGDLPVAVHRRLLRCTAPLVLLPLLWQPLTSLPEQLAIIRKLDAATAQLALDVVKSGHHLSAHAHAVLMASFPMRVTEDHLHATGDVPALIHELYRLLLDPQTEPVVVDGQGDWRARLVTIALASEHFPAELLPLTSAKQVLLRRLAAHSTVLLNDLLQRSLGAQATAWAAFRELAEEFTGSLGALLDLCQDATRDPGPLAA